MTHAERSSSEPLTDRGAAFLDETPPPKTNVIEEDAGYQGMFTFLPARLLHFLLEYECPDILYLTTPSLDA